MAQIPGEAFKYAEATTPASPEPTPGPQQSPITRRRFQDDSVFSPVTAKYGCTYQDHRVGVPPLQLLPLSSISPDDSLPAVSAVRAVKSQIHHILRDHRVEFDEYDAELVHRVIPGDDVSPDTLTYLVIAQWFGEEDTRRWFLAAEEIKDLFRKEDDTAHVKVEISGWQLARAKTMSIVEHGHPFIAAWPRIRQGIQEIFKGYPKVEQGWNSIDVVRIGYLSENAEPMPVTISILVDWELDERDWRYCKMQIQFLLQENAIEDVEVSFERGDVEAGIFPLKEPTRAPTASDRIFGKYDYKVPMGSDFGANKDSTYGTQNVRQNGPTGTIGGYIELRYADGEWKKYAVTNYHCVREAIEGFSYESGPDGHPEVSAESFLAKVDAKGIGPRGPNGALIRNIAFESPSRRKHDSTIHYHRDMKARRKKVLERQPNHAGLLKAIDEHEADERDALQFFDTGMNNFGRLALSSGFKARTKENHRIDIALIEIDPARVGDNM
ncbi:MAG: hypothetical protein Q9174_002858, partial [Haloplaca sp. 1 TL-2023]